MQCNEVSVLFSDMASQTRSRYLGGDEIAAALLDSDDEELNLGEDSEDEPDGVIKDFRDHSQVASHEDSDQDSVEGDEEYLVPDNDGAGINEEEGRRLVRVLDFPLVLYGKGHNNRLKWTGVNNTKIGLSF